ncbi:MAG: carbohydrate ABC transporter permease [Pseudothermotoga sp.]
MRWLYKTLIIIGLILLILASVVPIYWTFATSISKDRDLSKTSRNWFPPMPTLDNYRNVLGLTKDVYSAGYQFTRTILNSLIISVAVTFVTLFFAILAAYAIERLQVPLREYISFFVVLTQMLPPAILVIPIYLILSRLNLLDSKLSLSVVYVALNLPFAMWIIGSYFRRIPASMEEAAIIDGCGYLGALWKILLPISKPALFTSSIFVFLAAWNEFIMALVLTTSMKAKTMPIGVAEFMGRFYTNYPLMTAAGVISMIPPIVFAIAFQPFLVEGLAKGAVKE